MTIKLTWIKVKRGLLTKEHKAAMGESVWGYLWILDQADWETGMMPGYKDQTMADYFGMSKGTAKNWRYKLQNAGYITSKQSRHSLKIIVHNWTNPREYSGKLYNIPRKGDKKLPPSKSQGDNILPPLKAYGVQDVDTPTFKPQLKDSHLKNTAPFQDLFDAIFLATAMDPKIKGNAARIGMLAKELLDAGYEGSMIELAYVGKMSWWFKRDWRGRKGSLPTLQQIKDTIGQATQVIDPGTGKAVDVRDLKTMVDEAKKKVRQT